MPGASAPDEFLGHLLPRARRQAPALLDAAHSAHRSRTPMDIERVPQSRFGCRVGGPPPPQTSLRQCVLARGRGRASPPYEAHYFLHFSFSERLLAARQPPGEDFRREKCLKKIQKKQRVRMPPSATRGLDRPVSGPNIISAPGQPRRGPQSPHRPCSFFPPGAGPSGDQRPNRHVVESLRPSRRIALPRNRHG